MDPLLVLVSMMAFLYTKHLVFLGIALVLLCRVSYNAVQKDAKYYWQATQNDAKYYSPDWVKFAARKVSAAEQTLNTAEQAILRRTAAEKQSIVAHSKADIASTIKGMRAKAVDAAASVLHMTELEHRQAKAEHAAAPTQDTKKRLDSAAAMHNAAHTKYKKLQSSLKTATDAATAAHIRKGKAEINRVQATVDAAAIISDVEITATSAEKAVNTAIKVSKPLPGGTLKKAGGDPAPFSFDAFDQDKEDNVQSAQPCSWTSDNIRCT